MLSHHLISTDHVRLIGSVRKGAKWSHQESLNFCIFTFTLPKFLFLSISALLAVEKKMQESRKWERSWVFLDESPKSVKLFRPKRGLIRHLDPRLVGEGCVYVVCSEERYFNTLLIVINYASCTRWRQPAIQALLFFSLSRPDVFF